MIITDLDKPLTAEEARYIALNNKDDSKDRNDFRNLMKVIRNYASFGHTRYSTAPFEKPRENFYSETVQNALRSVGFRVIEKRSVHWDEEKQDWDQNKPRLDAQGREQFFIEIYWG